MHQTTRRGEYDIGVLLQHLELRLDRLTSDDNARMERCEVRQLLAHAVRLICQFAGGRQHDASHAQRALPLLQLFDHGNDERRRLTAS